MAYKKKLNEMVSKGLAELIIYLQKPLVLAFDVISVNDTVLFSIFSIIAFVK